MKRIVAVVGDYYHDAALIKESLEAAQREQDVRWQVEYATVEQLTGKLSENPEAVLLFKEDRIQPQDAPDRLWMSADLAARIVSYVESGGGWLAWHSGLASYAVEGAYVQMLRGYFKYHPSEHQTVTYVGGYPGDTAAGGAECRERAEDGNRRVQFAIVDEHYFVHCDTERTNVFLRSRSVDGESIAGWSHSFGKGRVCCLTPAHLRDGLLHPEQLGLLRQCISWLAG
ncbi:ThuA domain-containing protein [Paenibacillus chartarius]|uniref:ThuA domain-containing protein n=1 Tax=Paenibacillus chartarius TaxID=747481 RepID=A0ABV6DEJ5_9BACL